MLFFPLAPAVILGGVSPGDPVISGGAVVRVLGQVPKAGQSLAPLSRLLRTREALVPPPPLGSLSSPPGFLWHPGTCLAVETRSKFNLGHQPVQSVNCFCSSL